MLKADFRHIAFTGKERNRERLFRAAITAFCSLTRPTRNEIAQLDDLTLGLYDAVSTETRRFAAAALCECAFAPPGIIHRLCAEPIEIAAPLLVRSRALSDIDLIALIGRHGLSHARVIARRDGLNPAIASLIRTLIARAQAEGAPVISKSAIESAGDIDRLEPVRERLREVMRDSNRTAEEGDQLPTHESGFSALLNPALAGDRDAFAAALGRAIDFPASRVRGIAAAATYSDLMICLKAAGLGAEQAFVITAATYPAQVSHPSAIRLFLQRYDALGAETAREKIANWRQARLEENLQSVASAR
ncbi:hypothetical protein [Chelativorans sp. YIM 93263]|uniref:hypothetical protein n=1 Tax=Chelativorans sp. YIM 93263 TaxID=2906648 RepID=UPI00237852AE|nr:hypothetical protein [Chelativorans sp. YIM 93263]